MPYAYNATWPTANSIFWDVWGGDNNNRVRLSYDDTSDKILVYINGAYRLEWLADFDAGDWLDILVALDYTNDTYALYINGVQKDTDTTALTAPAVTDWTVGCGYGGASGNDQSGAVFSEYSVFDKELTEEECAALGKQMRPIIDMGGFTKPGIYILDGAFRMSSSLTHQRIEMFPHGMGIYAGDGETGVGRLLGGFVNTTSKVLDPDSTDLGWFGYDSSNNEQVAWYGSGTNAGKLLAGGGYVILDSVGIRFQSKAGSPTTGLIRFEDAGHDIVSYMYGHDSGSTYYTGIEVRKDLVDSEYNCVALLTVRDDDDTEHLGFLAAYLYGTSEAIAETRIGAIPGTTGEYRITGTTVGDVLAKFDESGNLFLGGKLMVGSATYTPGEELHVRSAVPVIRMDDSDAGNATACNAFIEFGSSTGSWNRHGFFGFPSATNDYMTWNNEDGTRNYIYVNNQANTCFHGNVGSGINAVNIGANTATLDTKMNYGLKIDQGGYDNNIFSLYSSDVSHGFTTYADAGCFAAMAKAQDTSGGLVLRGFKDADGVAGYCLNLQGYLDESTNVTKDSSGYGQVNIRASERSGTGGTTIVSNGNIMSIQNYTTTVFLFDAEGSAHAEIEWIAMDDYDDVALLKSLEHHVITNGDPIKKEFGQFLEYNKDTLEQMNLAHFEEDRPGRAMVNFTRLSMLLTGAVKQLNDRLERYEHALVDLGVDPKLLEAHN